MLVVKLGGSLITDKKIANTARGEVLERLAAELARCLDDHDLPAPVLIHGSGSFGHAAAAGTALSAAHRPEPANELRPAPGGERLNGSVAHDHDLLLAAAGTQLAARALHARVMTALLDHGVPALSLPPSALMVLDDGVATVVHVEPLVEALDQGFVPVLYGDVVVDRRRGATICSSEYVVRRLAEALPWRHAITRALWLGSTRGIYDAEGDTIAELDREGLERARQAAVGAAGIDTTGGMEHRLETAVALARRGVESWILDGSVEGVFAAALRGGWPGGTRVPACPEETPRG